MTPAHRVRHGADVNEQPHLVWKLASAIQPTPAKPPTAAVLRAVLKEGRIRKDPRGGSLWIELSALLGRVRSDINVLPSVPCCLHPGPFRYALFCFSAGHVLTDGIEVAGFLGESVLLFAIEIVAQT